MVTDWCMKAYIAISLDATGLIRFLAFWVLKKGGKVGHRLYFLLYTFFFSLGTFIGNVSPKTYPCPEPKYMFILG